jgi:hypothetical protein
MQKQNQSPPCPRYFMRKVVGKHWADPEGQKAEKQSLEIGVGPARQKDAKRKDFDSPFLIQLTTFSVGRSQ